MSRLFPSKWSNTCPQCDERWAENDEIGFIPTQAKPVCRDCWSEAQKDFQPWYKREPVLETKVENICPDCWTIHKGECI